MENLVRFILSFGSFLLLTGCMAMLHGTSDQLNDISIGMSKGNIKGSASLIYTHNHQVAVFSTVIPPRMLLARICLKH